MKSVIIAVIMLCASSTYAQSPQHKKGAHKPSKPPVDIAELVFKRMDSDKDNSISLKEFKAYWTKRQSGTSSRGRSRSEGYRGRSHDYRGRSGSDDRNRSHRGKSKRGS